MTKLEGIDLNRDIKKFREEHGLSIRKAAELAGLKSPAAWQYYEDSKVKTLPLDRFLFLFRNLTKERPKSEHSRIFWSMFELLSHNDDQLLRDVGALVARELEDGHEVSNAINAGIDPEEAEAFVRRKRSITITITEDMHVQSVAHGWVD